MSIAFRSKVLFAAGAVAVLGLLAAAPSQSVPVRKSSPTIGARVSVMDNYFEPRSATIEKGEAVRWNWKGDNRHNVVFTKVPAAALKKNARSRVEGGATRALTAAGTYHYACSLYDGMEGMVNVDD
jgi:plastocyanin